MKLQQAYVSEANALGTWTIIGYKGPGEEKTKGDEKGGTESETTNFKYKDAETFTEHKAELNTAVVGFSGESKNKLNDCPATSVWSISAAASTGEGDAGEVTFTPDITNEDDCQPLTPQFKTIGK